MKTGILRTLALALVGASLVACSGGGGGGASIQQPSSTAPGSTTNPGGTGGSTTGGTTGGSTGGTTTPQVTTGDFTMLTYNVAGLPQIISGVNPLGHMPLISPKLNAYDLVLVQEDFAYHPELAQDVTHPFQSQPQTNVNTFVNDGLNQFSQFDWTDFRRETWHMRYGLWSNSNDGLSSKGFSVCRMELAPGVVVDVYNLHADAGGAQEDIDARASNFSQLTQFMQNFSPASNAVIVAGDTNLKVTRAQDEATLQLFLQQTNMQVVARVLGQTPDLIDRVMWRNGTHVQLDPQSRRLATEMRDASGNPLSDHEGIVVNFVWQFFP